MSNSRTQPSDPTSPVAEYATGRLWGALLDEDPLDIEFDLLAAYSEGALDEPERQRLKSMIARSPRAMELLHGLQTDLRVAAPDALPQTSPARPVVRPNRMLAITSWLVAVALLMAFGTTYRQLQLKDDQWQLTDQQLQLKDRELQAQRQLVDDRDAEKKGLELQVAALNTQLSRESAVAAAARRERMYVLSSSRPPYMASRGERDIATLALAYHDQASRGIEKSSPETQVATDAEINTLLDQAEAALSARPDNATARLELAAQLLAAGRLEDARNLIAQIEQGSGETAATLNLRAAIDLTEAYEATLERARELQMTARELLQRAMQLDPQDPRPWFNLALLEEELGNDEDAIVRAWREYLARETDEALKKVVLDSRKFDQ